MDSAGASRALYAVVRLLAAACLVALPALVLAAAPARAQPPGQPGQTGQQVTPPGHGAPDQTVDDGDPDEHGRSDEDYVPEGDEHDWQDDDRPLVRLLPGVIPPGRGNGNGRLPLGEEAAELPAVTSAFVAGKVARMRIDGKAAIPRRAPKRVRSLIAQYNRIVGKRYKWGGGHGRLVDSGYDCSGAVGYGLIKNGLQRSPMVSGSFARWGAAGAGRWVTVYAHKEHVYIEVAGLRLDTSAIGDHAGGRGVRWRPVIGQRRGFKVRHPVGL